jgi:CheY-like chemotaxis protein
MLRKKTSPDPAPAARPLTIVVADDIEEITKLVRQCLAEQGHSVTCVGSGRELLKVAQEETFDLAIVDIVMPDGDGHDAIAALTRLRPTMRILAMSGGGRLMPADPGLRFAKGLGADSLLPKPFTRDQLLAAVAKASSR